MTNYYQDILIDPRTSCTRDGAAALLLGLRSWNPIYGDLNPKADPSDVREHFMEWLDTSVFEIIIDERNGFQSDLVDAQEENNPDAVAACRKGIVDCDNTIRRAKLILCDIDDELAKGNESKLRCDTTAFEASGQVHITLASLKAWAAGRDYLSVPLDVTQPQVAPPVPIGAECDEPLLNANGGMTAKSARSFLVTFAILLEQFVARTGKDYVSDGGTGMNEQAISELLSNKSKPGAREGQFLDDQGVSSIKVRIKKVLEAAEDAAQMQRDKPQKVKKVVHKS